MNDANPYDAKLKSDPKRHEHYIAFCSLYHSWENEWHHLQGSFRNSNTDEKLDDMNYALSMMQFKKSAVIQNYAKLYSRYKLYDNVQVVENNRVQFIGQIQNIRVIVSPKDASMISVDNKIDFHGKLHVVIEYVENEFVYTLRVGSLLTLKKTYIKESPRIILPKPYGMLHECPICKIEDKPMKDAVIGGENKVICVDCDFILNELFGNDHVRNHMDFNDISNLPAYDIIWRFSANK